MSYYVNPDNALPIHRHKIPEENFQPQQHQQQQQQQQQSQQQKASPLPPYYATNFGHSGYNDDHKSLNEKPSLSHSCYSGCSHQLNSHNNQHMINIQNQNNQQRNYIPKTPAQIPLTDSCEGISTESINDLPVAPGKSTTSQQNLVQCYGSYTRLAATKAANLRNVQMVEGQATNPVNVGRTTSSVGSIISTPQLTHRIVLPQLTGEGAKGKKNLRSKLKKDEIKRKYKRTDTVKAVKTVCPNCLQTLVVAVNQQNSTREVIVQPVRKPTKRNIRANTARPVTTPKSRKCSRTSSNALIETPKKRRTSVGNKSATNKPARYRSTEKGARDLKEPRFKKLRNTGTRSTSTINTINTTATGRKFSKIIRR